ncbi:hypothetical protein ACWJKU_13250 [Methylocaldum sp. MU1018]
MTTNEEKLDNVVIALLFLRNRILDLGAAGDWPRVVKTLADRLRVPPDQNFVHRLVSEFYWNLLELRPGALAFDDEDVTGSDAKVERKAFKRLFPLFEGYLLGRLQGAFDL